MYVDYRLAMNTVFRAFQQLRPLILEPLDRALVAFVIQFSSLRYVLMLVVGV
jgi:hypothetical protein